MQDLIEHRPLYNNKAGLRITVDMVADTDSTPMDADCYTNADIDAWRRDEWRYVGLIVDVLWHDRVIGSESLWGVEHGTMPEPGTVDALKIVAPVTMDNVTMMGSPAGSTIDAALATAEQWLTTLTGKNYAERKLSPAREWLATHTDAN